ncbi:MAG: CDP-glycerol glycerophosphotransferase family protein [Terrimesophilobacter sp.]
MTVQRTVALNSITFTIASASALQAQGSATTGPTADPTPFLTLTGTGPAPRLLELVGPRLRIVGSVTAQSAGWEGTVPLLASRWGSRLLAPPSGNYRIKVDGHDALLDTDDACHSRAATLEEQLVPGLFRIAATLNDGVAVITISPPLTDEEVGVSNQSRLEAQYRSTDVAPRGAVFFESFYGQNASCNPLALDRALASLRPEVTRYWAVADASVDVPDGAVGVIEGSAAWWQARAESRLIVINDWLRNRFRKRKHQTVLQTWHGTMLKKLALSRSRLGLRPALATLRERSRWDILLAQNDYAARIFRRAYAYFGTIWEEGYPRDDALLTGDPSEIRARLGIPPDVRVLLYAPTWRDDRPDHVDHLDVSRFAELLGPGYVTLIRGHSRTLQPGVDVRAGGVLDVTSYPDVSDLFLTADALITDYSSVMFDFSVTGKPIFFFTPDLDRYRQVLRGFYFDLLPVAPGPLVQKASELVELVHNVDAVQQEFAEKYASWQKRFNPHDDGRAAESIITRLTREGKI